MKRSIKLLSYFSSSKKLWGLLLIVVVLSGVFWKWWEIGPKVANDFPQVDESLLKAQFNIPQLWSERGAEGLGEYTVFTLWSYPQNLIIGLLAQLGLSFSIIERVVFFIPFLLLGSWSIYKTGEQIGLSRTAIFFSTLFYLTGTYPILLMDGGQLSIGLAYAWFPLCFLMLKQSIDGDLKEKTLAGITIFVLGFLDIRLIYLLVILSIIYFLFEFIFLKRDHYINWIIKWLNSSFVIGLIVLGLNTYWLLPILIAPINSDIYRYITQTSFENFINLGHTLFSLAPNWFLNVYGQIAPLLPEFGLIPVLIFLAPILRPKDKNVGFWLSVALLSIFLTKGPADPLRGVYLWLFHYLPGFSLFRDPTKFFFLLMLAYSILFGITVNEVRSKIKTMMPIKVGLISLTFFYLLFLIRPVYLGQMTGTLSQPRFQQDYVNLKGIISQDKEFGRVFWIPSTPPLVYSDPNHPITEAIRLFTKRPFAIGTVGTYEVFNFLRDAPFMGEIFNITGIKYIVYPFPDPVREHLKNDEKEYYDYFLKTLANLSWTQPVSTNSAAPIIKTKVNQNRIFSPENLFWIIGSDRIYSDLITLPGFHLEQNALVFVEEYLGLGNRIAQYPNSKVILFDKTEYDLLMDLVDANKIILPSQYLDTASSQSSWKKIDAKDIINWKDYLHQDYQLDNQDFDLGGNWLVANDGAVLTLDINKTKVKFNPQDILITRVMESSQGGTLKFYQGNNLIGIANTKITQPKLINLKLTGKTKVEDRTVSFGSADFHWQKIGQVQNSESLQIVSSGNINAVNALAIVSSSDLDRVSSMVNNLKSQGDIIDWNTLSLEDRLNLFKNHNNKMNLSFQQLDQTHYYVRVSKVKAPGFLALSENYDPKWQLNGQSSLPLYSLINGFAINQDGEYDIYFSPQRYVIPGLTITGLILLAVLSLLIFPKVKKS